MTLIIGLGTTDGIVIGIDTRFTNSRKIPNKFGEIEVHHSYMDGGHKILLSHSHPNYGIAYVGQIHQGEDLVTPEIILAEFDKAIGRDELPLLDFAKKFGEYVNVRAGRKESSQLPPTFTAFWIFGLDLVDSKPKLYRIAFPQTLSPELIIGGTAGYQFQWEGSGGASLHRMILGVDENLNSYITEHSGLSEDAARQFIEEMKGKFQLNVNVRFLSIEDAASFAESLIQIVHFLEKYAGNLQAVGPFSDVVSITPREGARFIRGRSMSRG